MLYWNSISNRVASIKRMKLSARKISVIILLFIILAAFGSWFWGRVPEPEYDGKKLGAYPP